MTCRHYLCSSCITPETISCPCNNSTLSPDQLCNPSPLVFSVMSCLLVWCTRKCGQVLELQHLQSHLRSDCTRTEISPPSSVTVEQLLHCVSDQCGHGRETSLLVTHTTGLLAEKLFPSSGGHITCRSSTGKVHTHTHTHGHLISIYLQPVSLVRITTPRVESRVASNRTLKRRSSEIEQVRDLVSKGSSMEQLKFEVKGLTKEERENLLDFALSSPLVIPCEDVLAMKADLSITWSKLRDLRRCVVITVWMYTMNCTISQMAW